MMDCDEVSRLDQDRYHRSVYVHHGHRLAILSETDIEVLEELVGDDIQSVLVKLELLFDVVEDGFKVSRFSVHESGCGGHGEVENVRCGRWGI